MREVHQALRIIMDNDGRTADHLAEIDDSIVSLIARLGHPRPGCQVARSCGSNSFLLGFRVSTLNISHPSIRTVFFIRSFDR